MPSSDLQHWYLTKQEPVKSCLLALRSLILNQDSNLTETWKYKMPCFCFKQKQFCYLWIDKKTHEPYILMVDGKLLKHPALEQGGRLRMKIFRVNTTKDLPVKTIKQILKEGLVLHRTGLR